MNNSQFEMMMGELRLIRGILARVQDVNGRADDAPETARAPVVELPDADPPYAYGELESTPEPAAVPVADFFNALAESLTPSAVAEAFEAEATELRARKPRKSRGRKHMGSPT